MQDEDLISELLLYLFDLGSLLRVTFHAQAAGHAQADRMVGKGDDLDAPFGCRPCHLQHRKFAIAPGGVGLQVGFDVLNLEQPGEFVRLCRLDLAAVFTQFRRNPWQAEGFVHLLLGGAQDLAFAFDFCERVLRQRQSFCQRDLPQADVVIFGAGGIHERRAKLLGWMDPQLGPHAIMELDAGLRLAFAQHAIDTWQLDESLHHGSGVFGRDQDVQVAHSGTHPPQASGRVHIHNSLYTLEDRSDFHGTRIGSTQRNTRRPPPERGDPLENGRF